jgi:hypothetical protein
LKTRTGHNEQLSKEVLDFIEKQENIKEYNHSGTIPLYEQCHQANICVWCDRFIVELMNYVGSSQGLSFQI